MRRILRLLAASAALPALLACGSNNGAPTGPVSSLDGSCWRLEAITAGGWPGPVTLVWADDPMRPDCGMTICFEAGGRLTAGVSCNDCGAEFRESGERIEVRGAACTDAACTCGPPGAFASGDWPVVRRDAERLHLEIPTVTPGPSPVVWQFVRE